MENYNYNQLVVVAETRVKLSAYNETSHAPYNGSKFSMYFADYEWECTFDYPNSITLEFKVFRDNFNQVEIVLCDGKFRPFSGFPLRRTFRTTLVVTTRRRLAATWRYDLFGKYHENVYLVLRVLGDRSSFPDFTSPNVQICNMKSNGKLRAGENVFHVNKELLSIHSPYFNALFNKPNFDEAKQDVGGIEGGDRDKGSRAFPLKNVADLLELARFYQVDHVRDKCVNCLKFAHDMPVQDRIALAQQYGLEELKLIGEFISLHSPYFNNLLFNNTNFEEANQDEVELKGETETNDPALFHDFLSAMVLKKFLPNVKNVSGLLALAQFYQVDNVRAKCENCLQFARDMPVLERFALAKQYGLEDLVCRIIEEQKTSKDHYSIFFASLMKP